MLQLPQPLFDIYTLSLPRGHGFGSAPPVEAWRSNDDNGFGAVTRDVRDGRFGVIALRRRVDQVWTVVKDASGVFAAADARGLLESFLKDGAPLEPLFPNTAPRPALYNFENREPSAIFKMLARPSHRLAAWMLNQLYLSLPAPDKNWAADCQTGNFHTRLWEAILLGCLREQGLLVTQPFPSPDFRIENRLGGEAWIEAVTANPSEPYDHANTPTSSAPLNIRERLIGGAAERFAKTLGNKLQRHYDRLTHVAGKPFVLALADFQSSGSMMWSREALISYLYGFMAQVGGRSIAYKTPVTHLLGKSSFPAGLFANSQRSELSAVIFSNACSIAKLYRVAISGGASTNGFRYTRMGDFFDRTPDALVGIPFCLDISSDEYRALWPQRYEPWSAELEMFHNPFAERPFPKQLLPEATHWFEVDGEMVCESVYETSILSSRTLVQDHTDDAFALDDFLKMGGDEKNEATSDDAHSSLNSSVT